MILAVDFDGTLVSNKYPEIGDPKIDVINFCKKHQAAGHTIILWTCRTGEDLNKAVEYLANNHDFKPNYINANAPYDTSEYPIEARKIGADYYIDDRAINVRNIEALEAILNAEAMPSTLDCNADGSSNASYFYDLYGKHCLYCNSENLEYDASICHTKQPFTYLCRCKDCKKQFYLTR